MSQTNDFPHELKQTKGPEKSQIGYRLFSGPGPAFLDPLFNLFDHSERRIKHYIEKGQIIADIGCGWGRFSFMLADMVGPEGKVYSVDILQKCVDAIRKKATKRGYYNIEVHASSAADLSLIKDSSVDFVFANGLLCSMATNRSSFISEVKRILKPSGYAYLYVGTASPMSYIDQTEWEEILSGLKVIEGDIHYERWAFVSTKL